MLPAGNPAANPLAFTGTITATGYNQVVNGKTPKDQANGVYITTPAPVYDANNNVTQKTAPNGAVSTAVYDANDGFGWAVFGGTSASRMRTMAPPRKRGSTLRGDRGPFLRRGSPA